MFTCHTILHTSYAFNSKSSHKLSQDSNCSVPNDCAGVEELNVATIYMRVLTISRPFHRFHAWMCRGECATNFTVHCQSSWALRFLHWALPTLLGAVNFLGAINFLGATYSPGHCVFHSALLKFTTKFLAEMKFAQRNTRMALPIGTYNQGV
jgi:hypothetical protein